MPTVPSTRITGDVQRMLAGEPISSADFQQQASLMNWLVGQGRQLVPNHRPVGDTGAVTLSAGSYYQYRYWDSPTYNNIDRLWSMTVQGEDYQLTVPGGSAVDSFGVDAPADLYSPSNPMSPSVFLQRRGSYSATAADMTLRIDAGNADCVAHQIGCFELNRSHVETAVANEGVDSNEFGVSQPIQRMDMDNLMTALGSDTTMGERVLLNWAVPYAVNGTTGTAFARAFTGASYNSLFKAGIPMLGRIRYVGDTTKSVQARIFCWVSGGGAATARVNYNGSTGTPSAISWTAGSAQWRTFANFTIDTEDLDVTDGRRGSVWKDFNIEIAVSSGTCYVASAFVAENN